MISKVKNTIARLLYPYGSIRTVLSGPLRGYRYIVGPAMGVTYAVGASQDAQTSFLLEKISDGEVVFDVGGNQGQLTLLFAHAVGKEGTVVAFEPIGELAEKIRQNVSLNNLGNVEVVAAAAAGQAGHAEFRYSEDHATQGMLQDTEPTYSLSEAKTVRVQTVTLDEIAQREGLWPDVMKVDVEGGAKSVFSGAQRVLDRAPDILIEQHGPEEQYAVKNELISRGYTARTLEGNRIEDPTEGWHNPLWCTKR